MGRRAIRTKSGRLTRRERRRRLAGSEPGSVVLLDDKGRLARKGVRTRGTRVELAVQGQGLMFDLDMRKLVELVAYRLAQHYRDALLRGEDPTGKRLPKLKRKGEGINRSFGVRSGELAHRWTFGKMRGSHVRASIAVFPVRDEHRIDAVRNWLARKKDRVEVMGIQGEAAQVIQSAVREWMFLAGGDGVATPATALTGNRWIELPEYESLGRWPSESRADGGGIELPGLDPFGMDDD